jgi:NodT family efflux transporter outer membrane factor (OMF) lipoprotein
MRRAVVIAGFTGAVLALGGCADARLSKPDVRLPGAFEAPAGAVNPQLVSASLDRWWTLFDDPQLQQLIEAALVAAPDARTAVARLQEAEAVRRTRLVEFLPQGNLQGSATTQHSETSGDFGVIPGGVGGVGGGAGGGFGSFGNSGDTQSLSANFNVSWELDLFGRARAARRGADAEFAATRFNVEASRMSLAAQVAQSLFQARALAVQLADARETARIAGELARVNRIRAERGLGTTADAARTRSELETAEAEVARLDAAVRAATRTLLVLLGRGTDPLASLPIEARSGAAPSLPASTPGELLERRPDVREAEARLRTAAATAQLDRLALFPKFTLQPGASISRSFGATDFSSTIWSLGVGAAVPVLDRPRLLAQLRADKARGEQAVIAYERAVQTAYGEAANALSTLEADQVRVGRLETAESQARFAFDAANKGFQAGLTDLTSLLDAERAWRAARSSLTSARAQALQDAVSAFKALGGGWSPPPVRTAAADPTR